MRILFIDWGNYGKEDIKSAMTDEGHEVISFPFEASSSLIWEQLIHEPETEAGLRNTLHDRTPDVVFFCKLFSSDFQSLSGRTYLLYFLEL